MSVPQARLLNAAYDKAVFRSPVCGGEWSYTYPGDHYMYTGTAVTCRALVKRGWLELAQAQPQYGELYVISAAGRKALEASGLRAATGQPQNLKF